MIRNIQLKHAGKYVCVVDTDVESLSVAAILIVKGKRATARHLGELQMQGLDLEGKPDRRTLKCFACFAKEMYLSVELICYYMFHLR